MFNTLHAMFMTQYTELWTSVDLIAERIRSLGHPAPGSYAQFGSLTSIDDVPSVPPKAFDMIAILVSGHEAVARTARALLPVDRKGVVSGECVSSFRSRWAPYHYKETKTYNTHKRS